MQLALEGLPYHKPRHTVGSDTIGMDLGPSTIALVAKHGAASLEMLGEELAPDERQIRRLQRKLNRQRRAANPEHFDEQGRIKKAGKTRLPWKSSRGYERTRQRKAEKERKLAAHRKSLHGRKVHEIVSQGNTVIVEKISYKAWQKQFGRSGGMCASVESVPFNETCIPRFWPLISIQKTLFPLVPGTLYPGRVRRRAFGLHKSVCCNVRMKGRSCPEAWALLVPERVIPKVCANRHQSPSSSSDEGDWKRGTNA